MRYIKTHGGIYTTDQPLPNSPIDHGQLYAVLHWDTKRILYLSNVLTESKRLSQSLGWDEYGQPVSFVADRENGSGLIYQMRAIDVSRIRPADRDADRARSARREREQSNNRIMPIAVDGDW